MGVTYILKYVDTSDREEYYQDTTLVVKGFKNLYESLENYVTFELLNGENQ